MLIVLFQMLYLLIFLYLRIIIKDKEKHLKRAIISVINDLATDRRVDRTANVLKDAGFDVLLVGRRKKESSRLPVRGYETNRMRLLWEKGFLFYAEYNIRLFFFLLGNKAGLLFSNDLDTALPNLLVARLKRIPVIFDSHEYFTETPEVVTRPFVKKVWSVIEKIIVRNADECITVNNSIADLFKKKYNRNFHVIRNISGDLTRVEAKDFKPDLPVNSDFIILQGAGINVQRGAEEAVLSMKYVEKVKLLIVGGGDVLNNLKDLVISNHLEEKVIFIPRQTPQMLRAYTSICKIGLSLDKDTNLNYHYSLPNKIFDYIHAGIPVLASPLPEIKYIIETFNVGSFISNHDPEHIAACINAMLDEKKQSEWRENCKIAATELNWKIESLKLKAIIEKYAG